MKPTSVDSKPSVISDRTFLPIGVVTIVLATACGGSWWFSAMYSRLEGMTTRLDRIEAAINENAHTAVTERDMRLWIATLKQQNPTITIPEWAR